MKILVAMSGGVDSSVAAALLLKEGHTVEGVTFATASEYMGHRAELGRHTKASVSLPNSVNCSSEDTQG